MTYQYECPKHGLFELICSVSEHSDSKPCPKKRCKKSSEQVFLPGRSLAEFSTPIIVHVAEDGAVRFPGHANARIPAGFQKKELRSIREIEQFERQMNQKLSGDAARFLDRREQMMEEMQAKRRSDLRQAMQHFSALGKDFARIAIERGNMRKRSSRDIGFHLEILHRDSSNREVYRDAETGWQSVRR